MILKFVLLVIGAYLFGSIPSAYLAAKWSRGIDIRRYGSGNVGASNLMALASKRLTISVIIFDMGKGAAAVGVAKLLGLGAAQQVTAGLAAIAGHSWPIFLGFNGGRGALTLAGVVLTMTPVLGLILLVASYLFAPFHQLALGVILAVASLPLLSWFFAQPLGIEEPLAVSLGFLALFVVTIIRRLTAPRTEVTDSVPPGELLVNRLLFDRDIRNRETWVHRAPTGVSPKAPSSESPGKQIKG